MNTWKPSLARSWFVVARSSQIGRKPHAVTLLDRPIVIARASSGELFALDDCCPHRHIPLSAGRMTEHGLQCAYHGWTFAADGRCVAIPGLPSGACQPLVRVGAASVAEYDGLVWVRLDGEAGTGAIASALPAFVRRPPAQAQRFVWHARWNARAIDALENFLDAQHTHFVHAGIVRSVRRRAAVDVTVARTGSALHVDYEGQQDQSGWLYRLFESRRELERAHFDASAAGTAQLEYRYRNGSALYFTLHFSPVSDAVTQVHGTLHIENRWAPRWAVRFLVWPLLRRVLQQDRALVEAQALNRQRCRRGEGISTELDLVRPALDAAWLSSGEAWTDSVRKVRVLL
ncbi:Rieske 2Fe-2S domain-containing protein [Trinickia sp.]|uniref:Rieske 2Fe-2S domain-containing protein n=1 Tax=Trinickia sp. TaxID=2571163 RepID=UPI003F7D63FE